MRLIQFKLDVDGGIAEAKLHKGSKGVGCVLDLVPMPLLEGLRKYVNKKYKERKKLKEEK